ncbi:MAG TPA: DUF3488 and transglutaminase-like domain-containing protein [Nitrospiraceae bacterium]|nr:DUF3488 and transglutaminase-like domain-containing protein [Nitrospiraceae bacterium]
MAGLTMPRALHASALLQTGVSFAALIATGKVPTTLIIIGGLSIVAALAQIARFAKDWIVFRLPRTVWNVVMIAAFGASTADAAWGSQDMLQASMYVLIFLMAHKLCTLRHHADFLHLYVISFLEFLSAAMLTVELWYAAVFVTYLLTTVWALLLWHLNREAEDAMRAPPTGQTSTRVPLSARFFWITNVMAMGALGLTLAMFFMMPRTGVGFFQKTGGSPIRTSGFSERVDLGGIGAVKQDQSLVMRVQFPDLEGGAPTTELYFRGVAFDRYNGRSWTNTFARRPLAVRNDDGIFTRPVHRNGRSATGIRQQILIEALDTSVLFGMPFVEEIQGNFVTVHSDSLQGWSLPVPMSVRFQYVALSALPKIADEDRLATAFEYPADILGHFLQLPPLSPRVAALALSVTESAKTPYQQIVSIQQHLVTNYRYSLDVGVEDGMNPLDDFLFRRKTGYCEHYATAMVLMLRTLGIPARLVTGFLPGEWNEFGNYYRVRQQDAHAWVEVFFPRSGWITFDPTPTVGAGAPVPMWRKLSSLIDSVRLKWDRFVIQYSFRDQIALIRQIHERSERARSSSLSFLEAIPRWAGSTGAWVVNERHSLGVIILMLVLVLSVFAVIAVRFYGNHRLLGRDIVRDQAIVEIYAGMLRHLALQGLPKTKACTPLEFSHRINAEWKDAGAFVTPITDLYCRVRYGRAPFLGEDQQRAEELLRALRAMRQASDHHPSRRLTLRAIMRRWKRA